MSLTPQPQHLLLAPLVLLALLGAARAHTYHMGSCPKVPAMPGFVTSKFLGRWHVLQKTATRVRCLSNEYSWVAGASEAGVADAGAGAGAGADEAVEMLAKARAKGEWEEEERPERGGARLALLQRMQMPVPGVNNVVRYAGLLEADPDPAKAASFTARFPLNMLGEASYVVFDTDYDTYAGVYTCQNVALWYRHSATIMARERSLSPALIHKLRSQLTSFGVNVNDLDVLRQTCEDSDDEQGIQVHIKPKVFRTNITEVLEDANAVVETAADAAKRAYDVYNVVDRVYTAANAIKGAQVARRRRRAGDDAAEDAEDTEDPMNDDAAAVAAQTNDLAEDILGEAGNAGVSLDGATAEAEGSSEEAPRARSFFGVAAEAASARLAEDMQIAAGNSGMNADDGVAAAAEESSQETPGSGSFVGVGAEAESARAAVPSPDQSESTEEYLGIITRSATRAGNINSARERIEYWPLHEAASTRQANKLKTTAEKHVKKTAEAIWQRKIQERSGERIQDWLP